MKLETNREFCIKAFRAIDNKDLCEDFAEGHLQVLRHFGIKKISSADLLWMNNPDSYVIVAEYSDTGEVVGGARVQLANDNFPLPIETAIGELDLSIIDYVSSLRIEGAVTGEICGLWNSRDVAGYGLGSNFLIKAAISVTNQLKMDTVLAFTALHTLSVVSEFGYSLETKLGDNGSFYYPQEDLMAYALILSDPDTLSLAREDLKVGMQYLRKEKECSIIEDTSKGLLYINYSLDL